jgi:hypothetical protein
MDLKDICINEREWVVSAQDRDYWRAHVNVALNLVVPKAMNLVISKFKYRAFRLLLVHEKCTHQFCKACCYI